MCRSLVMNGVIGPSAADSARYGISANITIAAAAGYRPASGPCLIAMPPACRRVRLGSRAPVAARELFAESADVPMYEVARRAGVGQATLYRNFPDRRDLAAALLDVKLARIEQLAREHADDPDAFFVLLRHTAESSAYTQAL